MNQEEYPMKNKPRGLCIIINYFDFRQYKHELPQENGYRNGSQLDVEKFQDIIHQLYFQTEIIDDADLNNLDVLEILDKFILSNEEYSEKYNQIINDVTDASLERKLSQIKYEAFVIIIGTHGCNQGILCSNGKELTFKQIINKINDYKVLKNKPKVILFNCCREDQHCKHNN